MYTHNNYWPINISMCTQSRTTMVCSAHMRTKTIRWLSDSDTVLVNSVEDSSEESASLRESNQVSHSVKVNVFSFSFMIHWSACTLLAGSLIRSTYSLAIAPPCLYHVLTVLVFVTMQPNRRLVLFFFLGLPAMKGDQRHLVLWLLRLACWRWRAIGALGSHSSLLKMSARATHVERSAGFIKTLPRCALLAGCMRYARFALPLTFARP